MRVPGDGTYERIDIRQISGRWSESCLRLMFGITPAPAEIVEALLLGFAVLIAFVRPTLGRNLFEPCENLFRRLASHRKAAILAAALAPVLLRVLLLPVFPPPEPSAHDEYCLLLQADTFLSGRLANPPHPFWIHFESIYLLSQPYYAAKYQPGQALALAAGKALLGNEWAGVVATMGVLCGLLCWMLRKWIQPEWALLGSIAAGIQYGVFSYWTNSFWGGTMAAIGGTLLLGAGRDLWNRPAITPALYAGLGLSILALTRPLEAALFAVVLGLGAIWRLSRPGGPKLRDVAIRAAAPVAGILCICAAGLAYYNDHVTGSAFVLPYALHIEQYGTPQGFYWQPAYDVETFRHAEIRDEYLRQRELHARRESPRALLLATAGKLRTAWGFYLGPVLTVPLLFLLTVVRSGQVRVALLIVTFFAAVHGTYHAFFPHYSAPLIGLYLFLVVMCWRSMRHRSPAGLFVSRALPVIMATMLLLPVGVRICGDQIPAGLRRFLPDYSRKPTARSEFAVKLREMGGRHLVFVRYVQPGHDPDDEWVYNAADIDAAPIVWAREWTPDSNLGLVEYFRERRIWLAEPDAAPPRLTELPAAR